MDAMRQNDIVLKELRDILERRQNYFVMRRDQLVTIEVQLAEMAFIAAQIRKTSDALIDSYRNMVIHPNIESGSQT